MQESFHMLPGISTDGCKSREIPVPDCNSLQQLFLALPSVLDYREPLAVTQQRGVKLLTVSCCAMIQLDFRRAQTSGRLSLGPFLHWARVGDEEFLGNRLTVGSESYLCKENESEITRILCPQPFFPTIKLYFAYQFFYIPYVILTGKGDSSIEGHLAPIDFCPISSLPNYLISF